MSDVTNVLLAFSILEGADARVHEVNGWLGNREQSPLGNVWRTETAVGGGKRMEISGSSLGLSPDPPRRYQSSVRSASKNDLLSR